VRTDSFVSQEEFSSIELAKVWEGYTSRSTRLNAVWSRKETQSFDATCTVHACRSHVEESKKELREHNGSLWELTEHNGSLWDLIQIVWSTQNFLISDTIFIFLTHWRKTHMCLFCPSACVLDSHFRKKCEGQFTSLRLVPWRRKLDQMIIGSVGLTRFFRGLWDRKFTVVFGTSCYWKSYWSISSKQHSQTRFI
jgi:hypothetical protein